MTVNALRVDLNAGTSDARPVVNVEVWEALPDDTADFLFFDAADHGGVGPGWTWDEGGSTFSPPAGLSTYTVTIPEAVRNTAFDLRPGVTKFLLGIETLAHDGPSFRAFGIAFSADQGETYGAPIPFTRQVEADVPVNIELEFYAGATERTLTSPELGVLAGVPANATDLRIGAVVGGEFSDNLKAGARLMLREMA